MILTKGNIRFIKLCKDDLELVRQWRNSPRISQYMEYREYITPEMQQEWFKSVNNKHNLYLIIEHDHQKIGLINAKHIDWDDHSLEGGIFFWEEEVYNTPLPAIVSLIFAEMIIRIIRLKIFAHIMKTNDRAIRYNRQLGFELCDGQEGVENQRYLLTTENYLIKSAKLRKAFYILIDKSPFVLQLERDDYVNGIAQMVEQRIDPFVPAEIRETESGKAY
ncbi:MAG: GNAT family N-acetyltransferase, partial [Bacteroidales bacterium]|nr:GNAT family N-acetyltransferase [Bacteroidales bacterium]